MSDDAKHTIYIQNLNHKVCSSLTHSLSLSLRLRTYTTSSSSRKIIRQIKDPELKAELKKTFEKFGKILQITSCCVFHLRGQAWITYDTVEQAAEAMKTMNEKEIFGRQVRIQYAKNKSDIIAKRDGTYKPRKKRVITNDDDDDDDGENKRRRVEEGEDERSTSKPRPLKPMPQNQILIAEDLPSDCTKELLQSLFKGFVGLEDIRLIASKNVAFIEFQNEAFASVALKNRNNHRISETHLLFLNYAKK